MYWYVHNLIGAPTKKVVNLRGGAWDPIGAKELPKSTVNAVKLPPKPMTSPKKFIIVVCTPVGAAFSFLLSNSNTKIWHKNCLERALTNKSFIVFVAGTSICILPLPVPVEPVKPVATKGKYEYYLPLYVTVWFT